MNFDKEEILVKFIRLLKKAGIDKFKSEEHVWYFITHIVVTSYSYKSEEFYEIQGKIRHLIDKVYND